MNDIRARLHGTGDKTPLHQENLAPVSQKTSGSVNPESISQFNNSAGGIFKADEKTGEIVLAKNTPNYIRIAKHLLRDEPNDDPNDPLNIAFAQTVKDRQSVDFGENGLGFITPGNFKYFARRACHSIHQEPDILMAKGLIEEDLPYRVAKVTDGLFNYELDSQKIYLTENDPISLEQAKNLLTDNPNDDPNDPVNRALAQVTLDPPFPDFGEEELGLITEQSFKDIAKRAENKVFYQDPIDGDNSGLG